MVDEEVVAEEATATRGRAHKHTRRARARYRLKTDCGRRPGAAKNERRRPRRKGTVAAYTFCSIYPISTQMPEGNRRPSCHRNILIISCPRLTDDSLIKIRKKILRTDILLILDATASTGPTTYSHIVA